MMVSGWVWALTIIGFVGIIIVDLIIVDRRPHAFSTREATRWVLFYISLALIFTVILWVSYGATWAGQFLAGYLTEYSLSLDNLFVFMVILSSFAVPLVHHHRVLLIGIVIALVLRACLILLGAEVINRFSITLFLLGGLLLYTAWKVSRSGDQDVPPEGNRLVAWVGRRFPTTAEFHGSRMTVVVDGRRFITPMLLVMLAIGTTDLLFAVDSIPAVFGLTSEAYIVFAANAFALMGLRQLYFLLHGLLNRLEYLNRGLAIVLGFIGVKLLLEGLGKTTSWTVPHVPTWLSLAVVVGVLGGTVLASVVHGRRTAKARSSDSRSPHEEPDTPLG
jgi:tellurite resistance protein TerC